MRIEELGFVCEEAARDLASRHERPLPASVVLPDITATRVVSLPDLPPDDEGRAAIVGAFVRDEVLPRNHPAYGFVAEGEVEGAEVVVVVYGAHGHGPRITAAHWEAAGRLGTFAPPEPLDPRALTFLHPLQHAVESATS